jgi:hypothetical protein
MRPCLNSKASLKVLLAMMLGLGLVLNTLGGMAIAQNGIQQVSVPARLPPSAEPEPSLLPLTYAHVVTDEAPVYADPAHALIGMPPVRSLGTGYLWLSLANPQPIYYDDQGWYLINQDEYVLADQLLIYQPSTFQGVALSAQPDQPFAWMVFNAQVSVAPGQPPAQDAPLLSRYTLVTIHEEQRSGDWMWYRVGEDQWVEQRNVGMVKSSPRPEGVEPTDKWLEVNLYEQTLAAYEGDRMVYATLVSSGLPQWPTQQGLFRMWTKVKLAKMSGRDGYSDYYYLEDVPWTMYFYESFALHGAYWHNRFGFPHSHGCVNLPLKDAQWLFEWVTPATGQSNWTMATADNPGAWVWVHD